MRILTVAAAIGVAASAPTLSAAETAPDCAKIDAAIPAPVEAWSEAPGSLAVAKTAVLTLRPAAEVQFKSPPEQTKPGMAGTFAFSVPAAGTYRIALGSAAWVDVIENGKAVKSVAHRHGPACTSIRKVVDFPLAAGEHWLQLNGSPASTIKVLIVAAPASR